MSTSDSHPEFGVYVPNVTLAMVRGASGGGSDATPMFFDDFSSGDLTKTENGFRWTHGPSVEVGAGRVSGNAARFRYGPDGPGEDSAVELGFQLSPDGSTAPTEVWVEYYLFIPANYVHRSEAGFTSNNKFFALWEETYSSPANPQFVAEFKRNDNTSSEMRAVCTTGVSCSTGNSANPVVTRTRIGNWVRVRVHLKTGNGDGIGEVWIDDDLVYRIENHVFYDPTAGNYWRRGYILGWSNSGFTDQTDFYVDEFKVFKQDPQWSFKEPLFADNFFSGDFGKISNGFSWIANGALVSDWYTSAGVYSAEFRYGPDAVGVSSAKELQFNLNTPVSEIWIEYSLLIPDNFVHRASTPSSHELFQLNYNGSVFEALTIEFDRQTDTTSSLLPFLSASQNPDGSPNLPTGQSTTLDFIGDGMILRPWTWHDIRIHYRASADGISNGLAELFVDGVLVKSLSWPFWHTASNGRINGGKFMGLARSGYTENTRWRADAFKFFTTNPGWSD